MIFWGTGGCQGREDSVSLRALILMGAWTDSNGETPIRDARKSWVRCWKLDPDCRTCSQPLRRSPARSVVRPWPWASALKQRPGALAT